ncbi:hypothetical protein [Methyloglobulus sp.]|uniref:hypothetical protein n=1 Tax=Methyloglobulus sp. TaxID=2518622 RepID=UPI0039899B13
MSTDVRTRIKNLFLSGITTPDGICNASIRPVLNGRNKYADIFNISDHLQRVAILAVFLKFLLDSVLGYGIYDFNRALAFFILISRLFSSPGKIIDLFNQQQACLYLFYSLTGHV